MYGDAVSTAARLVAAARERNEDSLLEFDGFDILEAAGIRCPRRRFVRSSLEAETLDTKALGSDRAVVKVVAPHIAHKSDVGGVAVVTNQRDDIVTAIRRMERAFEGQTVAGYSINE